MEYPTGLVATVVEAGCIYEGLAEASAASAALVVATS